MPLCNCEWGQGRTRLEARLGTSFIILWEGGGFSITIDRSLGHRGGQGTCLFLKGKRVLRCL